MIRPIPEGHGIGFYSNEQLPQYAGVYREEQVGRFWNYHVTSDVQKWPEPLIKVGPYTIDGFSPNLNKSLHVGHLRQLALAKSLQSLLHESKFVALLGASQGVFEYATKELNEWFDFVNYHPTLYYDVLMPRDQHIVPRWTEYEATENVGCEIFDGPKGPVIVVRSDGRPTYAFADVAFAKTVSPTHYITGAEQKEHFQSLGLGDKHLPMGLVLGADGKKMKSRTGDGVTAKELVQEIVDHFDPTPDPQRLAWNVVAWNFLHVSRNHNVKYDPVAWTKVDAPGMYITYTYARIKSALAGCDLQSWSKQNPDPQYDLTQADIELLGFAGQYVYYKNLSLSKLDPASLANYTYELAAKLGSAYHAEKIQGGRCGFGYAVDVACDALHSCMTDLGMFPLKTV